jgi:hypothetical protein
MSSALSEYLEQIDKSATWEEEELLQTKILELANADPKAFIHEVKAIPADDLGWLYDVYEALSYDAEHWENFYVEEIDRLLQLARDSDQPSDVLFPLNAFFQLSLDDEIDQLQERLRKKFYDNVEDENVFIRRKCVVLLGDFVDRKSFKALNKLEGLANSDPDWRVRYLAYEALVEADPERQKRVKLPRWIRIRVWFSKYDLE